MSSIKPTRDQLAWQRHRMCLEVDRGGRKVASVARSYGYSRKTAYKWLKRWRAGGRCLDAVRDLSRAPHRSPRRMSEEKVALIACAARQHPHCRSVRLQRMLVKAGISVSTNGLRRALRRAGILQPARRRHGKRRSKIVLHTVPGEHVQADLLQLSRKQYQLTLIDSATRYVAATLMPAKDVATVKKAIIKLVATFPFEVKTLQTDHGTEFTYAFMPHINKLHPLDEWCAQQGIERRLIPIAYPQANGKVERVHRIFREEFYRRFRLRPGQTWAAWLPRFVEAYNTRREHGSLEWRTPQQQLELLQSQATCPEVVTYV